MSTRAVARKKAYHHGHLRDALVQAAFTIARRAGPEALTLRAVAARAGVSEAAPYHHFADKRALLAAAAGVGFERFDARVVATLARESGELNRLAAFARAYVTFAIEEPGPFRLVFGAHVTDEDLAAMPEAAVPGQRLKKRARDLVVGALREVGAAGSIDPEDVFQMTWAIVHGWSVLIAEKELDPAGAESAEARRSTTLAEDTVRRVLESFRGGSPKRPR